MAVAPEYNTPYVAETVPGEVVVHATPASVGVLSMLAFLVAGWGAAVPFAGASFGFGADGHAAWFWDVQRVVIGLLPGIAGMVAAVVILASLPMLRRQAGTPGLAMAGTLMILAGAWFIVGPAASRVVLSRGYFVAAPPLRLLANQIGWALGPGVILAVCGAFAIGWSMRQRRVLARLAPVAVAGAVPAPSTVPVAGTVPLRSTVSAVPAAPVSPAVVTTTDPAVVTAVPPETTI